MPVPLRCDFDSGQLRRFARRTKDGPQARRLLALAAIYDERRARRRRRLAVYAADRAGLGGEVQRRGPDGLIDRKAPAALAAQRHAPAALATMIESEPMPAVHASCGASDRSVPVAL